MKKPHLTLTNAAVYHLQRVHSALGYHNPAMVE